MTPPRARELLVHSVISTVAEHGFEGLSVRRVAAHAGVSPGAVQHHFPTRAEMLTAAMTAIAVGVESQSFRIEQIVDPVGRLYALADALVPDSADDTVTRVWLAFAARAAVDEEIRGHYTRLWTRVRDKVGIFLAAAGGDPRTAVADSAELLALLDGFALGIVSEHGAIDSALARQIAHRRIVSFLRH